MGTIIQNIAKLSHQTFKNPNDGNFLDFLGRLRKLCGQLSADDVGLSREVIEKKRSSPSMHVRICENSNFSIGIFVLPRSGVIPLHDHPGMFGVVKVLYGKVQVKSYSRLHLGQSYVVPKEVLSKVSSRSRNHLIPCRFCGEREATANDEATFLLTPDESNIHEVSSVNGCCAFLDILSPPYSPDERDCTYFTVVATTYESDLRLHVSWLLPLTYPPYFWCDSVPYTGPPVK